MTHQPNTTNKVAWLPDDPIGWIENEYYSTETKQPIQLVDYQIATLREALRKDANGLFEYDIVVWGDIKKSAKSSIVGAVMLWRAWHNNLETCRIVGNDLKQAASRTFQFIESTIKLNPRLKEVCRLKTNNITLPNDTLIQAIPVDPGGEAGGADLMIAFTEVWAYKNESHKTMWTEMGLSPLKFGRSQTWVESYAGYVTDSPILENLYDNIANGAVPVDVGIPGLELYRKGRMLILWNTVPRCPWQQGVQGEAYYAQERTRLDDKEFNRIHRNRWTSSKGLVYDNWSIENITDSAEYDSVLGSIFWGCDDGYAHGQGRGHASYHPRVILLGQLNALGGLNIFYEYVRTGVSDYNASINEVASTGYPKPEAAYVDSSAPAFIGALWNHDIHAIKATHPVGEGIKNMRRLICDAAGKRLLFIHPRCTNLIYSLTHYKYADTVVSKGGESNPLKVDDNEADALRYLAWPLRHPED